MGRRPSNNAGHGCALWRIGTIKRRMGNKGQADPSHPTTVNLNREFPEVWRGLPCARINQPQGWATSRHDGHIWQFVRSVYPGNSNRQRPWGDIKRHNRRCENDRSKESGRNPRCRHALMSKCGGGTQCSRCGAANQKNNMPHTKAGPPWQLQRRPRVVGCFWVSTKR